MISDCKHQVADEILNDPKVLSLLDGIDSKSVSNLLPNDILTLRLKQQIRSAPDDEAAKGILIQEMVKCQLPDKMETFLTALQSKQRFIATKLGDKYDSLVIQHREKCQECKARRQTTVTGAMASSGHSAATGYASPVTGGNSDEYELKRANAVLDNERVKEALLKADYKTLLLHLPNDIITPNTRDYIFKIINPAEALHEMIKRH